jgi:hypothetical protein
MDCDAMMRQSEHQSNQETQMQFSSSNRAKFGRIQAVQSDRLPCRRAPLALALGAVSACLVATSVSAGLTAFTDRAQWLAASGADTVTAIDTATVPLGIYYGLDHWAPQGLRFPAAYADTFGVRADAPNTYGINVAESWGVDPSMHILKTYRTEQKYSFDQPRLSFGYSFALLSASINYAARYTDGTAESVWVWMPPNLDLSLKFLGFTTDKPFSRIDVTIVNEGSYPQWIRSFELGAPVPAPAAGVFALAFGAIGKGRRRRGDADCREGLRK